MDVRSEDDWDRAVGATRERFGPVDVLVNNAAILDVSPIAELGIRVNLVCPAGGSPELTRGFVAGLQQRRDAGEKIELRGLEGGVMGERKATPRDIANVVLFLASDDAGYCHGAEYLVDGGHTAGHIWFATQ